MKNEKIREGIRVGLLTIPLLILSPIFLIGYLINTQSPKEMIEGWYRKTEPSEIQ